LPHDLDLGEQVTRNTEREAGAIDTARAPQGSWRASAGVLAIGACMPCSAARVGGSTTRRCTGSMSRRACRCANARGSGWPGSSASQCARVRHTRRICRISLAPGAGQGHPPPEMTPPRGATLRWGRTLVSYGPTRHQDRRLERPLRRLVVPNRFFHRPKAPPLDSRAEAEASSPARR
jgi:hypothetical protein